MKVIGISLLLFFALLGVGTLILCAADQCQAHELVGRQVVISNHTGTIVGLDAIGYIVRFDSVCECHFTRAEIKKLIVEKQ